MSPSASRSGPPLPHEALLVPLLDVAADVLRELDPGDVPAALRPLAGFDRRGLARSAARAQMARALETEKAFRAKVVDAFRDRPEVQAALDAWSPASASKLVADAAGRDDLPLLVSALYADRPPGWEFGLGVASEAYERRRREDDAEGDRRAVETRVASADRARKRAEEARAAMEQQLSRLETELKEERRLRRAREEGTEREQDAVRRQIDQLETALAQARAALESEQEHRRDAEERLEAAERSAREAQVALGVADDQAREAKAATQRSAGLIRAAEARIDELERMVDRLEAELAAAGSGPAASVPDAGAAAPAAPALGSSELRVLDQVSRVAAELARQLDKLTQRVAAATALPDPAAATATATALPDPAATALPDPVPPVPAADRPPDAPNPLAAEATAAPVEAAPVEAAPVEAAPVEAAPVEAAPVEAAPVEAAPFDRPNGAEGAESPGQFGDDEPLDAIPVQVPSTTRRGRRRAPVPIPPGMLDDTIEAAEAMVRTPGLAIVVDGYNVSMEAWPELTLAQQRDRLCSALNELQLRLRCQVTVVFDGANVEGARPLRYPGLRVLFSEAGVEADEVVVRQVADRPLNVPVIVVSSDAWVRDHAEAEGARVIASPMLLKVLRR